MQVVQCGQVAVVDADGGLSRHDRLGVPGDTGSEKGQQLPRSITLAATHPPSPRRLCHELVAAVALQVEQRGQVAVVDADMG